ncbi:MAG: FAD-dependent oxidoreductase, partial [Malacoplasma sp.]
MRKYDLLIIGSGPGGYTAGEYAAKQGISTLVVEKENLGGVCLNLGCIPTKALLKSAKVLDYILHAEKYGVEGIAITNLTLNWKKILARKNDVVKQLQNGIEALLKSAKADLIRGHAKIIDEKTVEINGERIEFSKLIISSGSISRKLNLPGFDIGYKQGAIISSDEALSLREIPKTFTVIGGGVIGVEFA